MEKRKATYDLGTVKETFSSVEKLRMTRTARDDALALGLSLSDVVSVIQSISPAQLKKSMTSHDDHTVWQDVYNVPFDERELYVKFTMDSQGHLVLSFKEK